MDYFGKIDWWCDKCGALLNSQDGFSEEKRKWRCKECGHMNVMSEKNAYKSKAEFHKKRLIKRIEKTVIIVIALSCLLGTFIYFYPLLMKKSLDQVEDVVKDDVIGEEGEVSTITESSLTDVIKTSKLYTATYPYNGYCPVYTNDKEIKYYVAYEGTVKAGIDVNDVSVTLDENTNTITIYLPKVVVESPSINAGTMEFIFTDDKYNTETVAQEAYKYALKDLKNKVDNDENIIISATESAKTAEISFDTSKLEILQEGNNISLTLPEPQIDCTVNADSWNEDSYAISNDNWIQKNPITADDQTNAIDVAQSSMKENVINNSTLIHTAELQAKTLIENYINQIGELTDTEYVITWR